ncbi:DUF4153 domain-containing protein [Paraglaciecola sp.]|uniref:DUF4153 domain-containing protein n=1 Tax=Paraglaciecola sp. TaxID=1920173 RepID=UPI0030F38018
MKSVLLPKKVMLLVALIQGILLMSLHQAIEFDYWPAQSPEWLLCFYTAALSGPLMLLLALEQDNAKAVIRWILPTNLVLSGLAFYVGTQALLVPELNLDQVLPLFICTTLVVCFKTLMYAQNFSHNTSLRYHLLFRYSWRNFLTLGLSLLFTLCVWILLELWAQLFKVIGIDFFEALFASKWFYYPILSLAFGFGVIIFRSQMQIIDTLTRIQQSLMKFLLIILSLVSLLFLATLPFTGLTLLWNTGSGSVLILTMQGLILFFLNAVYQDEPNSRPYPLIVHRFVYLTVALLPIYSVIVFYGLYQRIEQYGWTVDRAWGLVLWGIFGLFSLGYLWGIVKHKDNWLHHLSRVNVRMGLLVLTVMLLVNSPVLDFRKITVNSQLAKLTQNQLKPEDMDLHYFRYSLAQPGYLALQELKQQHTDNVELQLKIDNLYLPQHENKAMEQAQFVARLTIYAEQPIPESLLDALYTFAAKDVWQLNLLQQGWLLEVDLDQDSVNDYLLIQVLQHSHTLTLFYQQDQQWLNLAMNSNLAFNAEHLEQFKKNITSELKVIPPRWQNLQMGELQLYPNN